MAFSIYFVSIFLIIIAYYQMQGNRENDVSIMPYVVSAVFLITFLFVILPLSLYSYNKQQQFANVTGIAKLKQIINAAADKTIFEYLDQLNNENTNMKNSSNVNRLSNYSNQKDQRQLDSNLPAQEIFARLQSRNQKNNTQQYHQIQLEKNKDREFDGEIICDAYDCCCQGCPWQMNRDNRLFNWYRERKLETMNWFFEKQKLIAFFLIKLAGFTYLPFNNLLFFTDNYLLITGFGLVFLSLQFFLLCFTLSFVTTKRYINYNLITCNREIVRLDRHNQIQRGLIVYYHLRKSVLFTFINLAILMTFSYIVYVVFGSSSFFLSDPYLYLNQYFNIAVYFHLLILIRYNHCLKNDLISDDDRILKAQQRLYGLQNNMIKQIPSDEVWLRNLEERFDNFHIKEKKSFIEEEKSHPPDHVANSILQEMDLVLEIKCNKAKESLDLQMHAVENQKFKKIKKNLGTQRAQITILTIYLYVNLIFTLSMSFLLCLVFQHNSTRSTWLDWMDRFSNRNLNAINWIYQICIMLQYTVFPYLIGVMVNKRALFGQDYGEWMQSSLHKSSTNSEFYRSYNKTDA